jgi:hypothetical protein
MRVFERLVCLVSACLLLVEVFVIGSRTVVLAAAVATSCCALVAIHVSVKNRPRSELIFVVLYSAGVIGAVAGYCYLALASSKVVAANEEVIYWGIMDKRPLVFGYLGVVAFIAFHWCMVAFRGPRQVVVARDEGPLRGWLGRASGSLLVALLVYCLFAVPALREVSAVDSNVLARFFDIHTHVHLASLEQIRLGATPYLEAQTQYGVGNQVLMNFLTGLVHYSNHGFFAGNVLLNVVCVILFFVVVQQFLGLGWAAAGAVGWSLWPSPATVIDVSGWAVFTRWLVIPILALMLAYLLLGVRPGRHRWLGLLLAGVIWGIGGFLSQESFTAGFVVFALSLALFGPPSGMPLRVIATFAVSFLGAGIVTFVALVAGFVGLSHIFEVLALANAKSSLVMAGLSNSIWSDALGVSLAFKVVHGRLYTDVQAYGELRELALTYGSALLLMLAIGLLAVFLGRRWTSASEKERQFIWKFGGVAVGAYALHLFTLLRSDTSHLAGPSFLLPLFLLMLPVFVWRYVGRGAMRNALLVISVGIVADAAIAGRGGLAKRVAELDSTWRDTTAALEVYRELRNYRGREPDLASRYSPIPKYQAAFRSHPNFADAQELFELLHDRLRGRRVEMGFHRLDDLIGQPDSFYFFGGFRSVSGMTSPMTSIWLRSDEDAWIAKLASVRGACILFEADAKSRLFEAWMKSARPPETIVVEPIQGRRLYGVLACKN